MGNKPSEKIGPVAEAILAVENAPLALVVASPDGRVQLANRALREMLGYGAGDLAGRDVWDFAGDVCAARQRWREVLEAGETAERLFEVRRQDGIMVQVRAASIVVPDDDGAPRFVITRLAAV